MMSNDKNAIKYDRRDRLCVTSGSVLWRAIPAGKGASVLMKCLEPGASSSQIDRLRREFELLGSLESPCMPKPRAFIGGGSPAIILEDFFGTPLDIFLKQRKPE